MKVLTQVENGRHKEHGLIIWMCYDQDNAVLLPS